MERRELLKALAIVPFTRLPFKEGEVDAVEVAPKKFWIFVDDQRVDIQQMIETPWPWPGMDAEIFRVRPGNRTIPECIAIYKIDGE